MVLFRDWDVVFTEREWLLLRNAIVSDEWHSATAVLDWAGLEQPLPLT